MPGSLNSRCWSAIADLFVEFSEFSYVSVTKSCLEKIEVLTESLACCVCRILHGKMMMEESHSAVDTSQFDLIDCTADIVSAYVSNNSVPVIELSTLIARVHGALAALSAPTTPVASTVEKSTPAQIRESITPDALISFVDGRPYKTLKRHLSRHGMTIEQYRERFGLPRDYPATAPSYSERRSALAKSIGLGQQRQNAVSKDAKTAATTVAPPKVGGRKKTAEPAVKPARPRASRKLAAVD